MKSLSSRISKLEQAGAGDGRERVLTGDQFNES
jgi:hypothetical protein